MKVILQKDVVNLGDAGEIKDVADGYARNYLIPRKLAIRASEGSAKMTLHQKRLADLKKEKRLRSMKELASKLDGTTLEIKVRQGENQKLFGSVTTADIAQALAAKGYAIDKRKIELDQNIKTTGEYKIRLKLAEGIQSFINVVVTSEV